MQDRLKALLTRIREWWNRFTTRQKTLIVVGASVALLTIIILITVLTRPKYVLLMNAETTKEASEVTTLLDSNSITYTTTSDGLEIRVLESQEAQANLLLGANDIQAADYSIDNVTSGGFSTTESDKQRKYVLYLENRLEQDFISNLEVVKNANVELVIPEDDGTLSSEKQEASASILLELTDPEAFTEDQAVTLAKAVATAIGNETTNNINIMDTAGNMLFNGSEETSATGVAATALSLKAKAEQMVKSGVKDALSNYDDIEVAPNLTLQSEQRETTDHQYYPPEGATQGVLSHEDTYSSTNENGNAGVPGTDTNDETTYVLQDNNNSNSTVDETSRDYLPNETITKTTSGVGNIDYENSSVSVTATNYSVLREEDARAQGLLADMSWDEYKAANAAATPLEVTDDMVNHVAMATGIPAERISILAQTVPVFFDSEGGPVSLTDVLQIVLILVILGLLAFVILRSMRTQKAEEEEGEEQPEELSVEQLLESQPEPEVEDIEMEESSETKQMIDKFVDENPEAAAVLLRNWLNEDYG